VNKINLVLRGAFPHQAEFLACQRRYAIAASGTKAGKSVAGAMYAVRELLKAPGRNGTWLAPTYQQAISVGLEAVRGLLPQEHVSVRLSGVPSLTIGGSMLEFKSGETPDNLFGPARDFAVLDEAGRLSEEAFNAVRSTLTPTSGPMRLLSNPTGRVGWFYRLWCRGLDDDPDVASFHWKTSNNPTIPEAEIEDARRTHSEHSFRCLYLGEFMDTGGSVFRNVRECAIGSLCASIPGRRYIGGLDLARTMDWSVASILDVKDSNLVAFERWHGVSWEETSRRVFELSRRYNGARFFVDSTGLGDPVLEQIERGGVSVQGVKFSSLVKAQLIEGLAATMERGELTFPPLAVLMGELESFEATTGATGTTRYAAPVGEHDDAVISLALAVSGAASSPSFTMDMLGGRSGDLSQEWEAPSGMTLT
jgi:Terminase large subunit, T4likevirus-type, N-terminal/Terminase RNaseH-like domain